MAENRRVSLHEYKFNEEFYAKFIHIATPDAPSVLVFNYGPEARELADRIARLMGEEYVWVENQVAFEDLDD